MSGCKLCFTLSNFGVCARLSVLISLVACLSEVWLLYNFSKQKNTPPVLQGKIKLILEKAFTDSAFDEEKIVSQLPVSLRQEVERHDRKSLRESTTKIPLFTSVMTSGEEKLLNVLMKVLHPLLFQSGDGTRWTRSLSHAHRIPCLSDLMILSD